MTGGGKRNSLLAKFSKFCKKDTYFSSKYIFALLKKIYLLKNIYKKLNHHGGILIEFAFSIPIVILLLLFVNDHYRFYELRNKVKSSSYLAASILQQLGNIKSNKQLTRDDFARISYASCLNFFHTNSMFTPWPFGVYFIIDYFWVKRISENTYQYQKCCGSTIRTGSPFFGFFNRYCENVQTKTLDQVQKLHPDLVCDKDGDERLWLSCRYRKINFTKSKIGFFFIEPISKNNWEDLIAYQLVISPKPGLFPAEVGNN